MVSVQHLSRCLVVSLSVLFLALGPARAEESLRQGWMVIDLESGRVLESHRPREPFIPASVAKVPSALATMDLLGADYRFMTWVAVTGEVRNGVLHGDLILTGGGDPSLTHKDMIALARKLRRAGITKINGAFIYDGDVLPTVPAIEPTQPPDAPYNPPLSGLMVDHSRFDVVWSGGTGRGQDIPLDPLPVNTDRTPLLAEEPLPVLDAARFAARVFQWAAAGEGVSLPAPEPGPTPTTARVLASHESAPLHEIVRQALYYSNNAAAEVLALSATGAPDLRTAADVLSDHLRTVVRGVNWNHLVLPNASGLSPEARMTPGQCAAVTRTAARRDLGGMTLSEILPGVLTAPFGVHDRRWPTPSRLQAKSGTIFYARALTGVFKADSGRELAFCIMSDDAQKRADFDALSFEDQRKDTFERPAKRWLKQARDAEEAKVLGWMRKY